MMVTAKRIPVPLPIAPRKSAIMDLDKGAVPVPFHDHLLVSELLCHVLGRGSRDLNPGLGKERTGHQDERDVEKGVDRIGDHINQGVRGGDVVGNAPDGDGLAPDIQLLPLAEDVDQHVGLESAVEELREEVKVGNQSRLEDDRNVRGVKELYWEGPLLTSNLLVLNCKIDSEALEVDDDQEDEHSRESKAIAFLHELVQKDDNHSCEEELDDNQDGVPGSDRSDVPVHSAYHVGHCLSQGDQQSKELLSSLKQGSLHHHARSYNGRNSKLHQSSSVRGQNDSNPVKGVRTLATQNSIERNLAANQKDEQRNQGPQNPFLKGHSAVRRRYLRNYAQGRFDQIQKS
ncbi:transport protein SEC61 subunit alpha [Cryptosporidium felis]|nr:transport protein SEC61 subunit alpha [Cryptosporidium felis]